MTSDSPLNPPLAMAVEVPSAFSTYAGPLVARAIDEAVRALAVSFGIPADPSSSIAANLARDGGFAVRVIVGGRRLHSSNEVLQRVYSDVYEQALSPSLTEERIISSLAPPVGSTDATPSSPVVDVLARLCVEAVKREPAVLLGPDQVRAYRARLEAAHRGGTVVVTSPAYDDEWLRAVLGPVLNLGLSIADVHRVAGVLASASAESIPTKAVVEDLIEALRPSAIDIRAPRAFLQELTSGPEPEKLFPFLREGLFEELGLELPAFRFVAADELKPRTFCFTVNHLALLPVRGLAPGTLLVNDTAERLALIGIEGAPATNPATGQPGCTVDIARRDELHAAGLTTWDAGQHLVLCLAAILRQHAHSVVRREWVRGQLEKLRWLAPALLAAVRARWSDEDLTGLLRELVQEGVSIRNRRLILERLVELDTARLESRTSSRGRDYALADAAVFVRIGLGGAIASQAARRTNTVVVYLLDAEIERMAVDPGAPPELQEAVLRACHAEFGQLPPTATRPSILTVMEARRPLYELLRSVFSRITVLAHEELPPGTNVQPVARITATPS